MEGQGGSEPHKSSKLSAVHEDFTALVEDLRVFAETKPHVENAVKLHRRAMRDLNAIRNAMAGKTLHPGVDPEKMTEPLVQGFQNNLAGFRAELQVALSVPGVIAVCKKFQVLEQEGKELPEISAMSKPSKIEVDVVAQDGHTWIEVKSYKGITLESGHWQGIPGHIKGLEQQIQDYLYVASCPNNHQRWRAPSVVIYFLEDIDEGVKDAITEMGAYVQVGPDPPTLEGVPEPPEPPTIANLDVTSMCALVSEVSHGGVENALVTQWAQRVSHWQDSLENERRNPLLQEIGPILLHKQLVATERAVLQFETLVEKFGGESELARWRELKGKLEIYSEANSEDWLSKRVLSLENVPLIQKHVFGLGDHLRALVITANIKGIQKLAHEGVNLEAFTHRAVWLTGL
ncbi:hypothetical protein BSKO_08870 [Bryopsis sp. KO-2023]|nr:hypothetical protein BSKO_08870 [Bryopsis sp. KO-2023]